MKTLNKYRYFFIFSFFIFISATSFGSEQEEIVKLESELENARGESKMKILQSLAMYYSDSMSMVATGYAAQYLKLAELNNSVRDQAIAYGIFSSIHKFQVEYKTSLKYDKKALALYERMNDSVNIAKQFYRISENYIFLHQYDSAIYYNKLELSYYQKTNNRERIFICQLQLGKIFCGSDSNLAAKNELLAAFESAKQLQNQDYLGWVSYWLAFTNMKLGEFSQAKSLFSESIENYISANKIAGLIGSKQALGELYLITGEFAQAYKLFYEANEKHAYAKGDKGEIHYNSQYYINIGNIFYHIGKFDQALAFYDSARKIATTNAFEDKTALINELTGQTWFAKGDSKTALDYFSKSLKYYYKINSRHSTAELLNSIGEVHEYEKNFVEAITSYKQALEINQRINNAYGIALNHGNLASCYDQTGALNLMRKELDKGMAFVDNLGMDNLLLRYYKLYIDYSENTGQHNVAHKYFDQYIPLSQKYLSSTKQNLSSLLIDLYENTMKEEDKIHEKELEFSKLEKERDDLRIQQLVLITSLIFVVLILIIYFLVNRIRTTRKLEHQVEERTKALRENEKMLIETNQTRDKFYSIIAHDLKSPFNSLIGFSNLLNDEYDDFSEEERKQFISIIRNSSEEIFALLENLLDWARKNSDKIKFKPIKVDLQQIVRQTVQLQEKNAEQKKISIINQISKNTFVYADENMLRTIIRNLTSNALKFSNEKGKVTFSATSNEGLIYCTVSDNGIGMSEKTKKNLFNIESKIKKKGTANETGTGLGLLLCKDFIERNGGSLTIESTEGQGTAFTFSLPAK